MFVDLATIFAGENDMDLDRVACFHDAVLGYSSMLYELTPEHGFDFFNKILKKLWNALDNDSNLPKKLVLMDTQPLLSQKYQQPFQYFRSQIIDFFFFPSLSGIVHGIWSGLRM